MLIAYFFRQTGSIKLLVEKTLNYVSSPNNIRYENVIRCGCSFCI